MLSKYSWPTSSTQFSTLFLFSEIIIIHQEHNNYKWLKRVWDVGWGWCRAIGGGRVGDAFTLTEVQSIGHCWPFYNTSLPVVVLLLLEHSVTIPILVHSIHHRSSLKGVLFDFQLLFYLVVVNRCQYPVSTIYFILE